MSVKIRPRPPWLLPATVGGRMIAVIAFLVAVTAIIMLVTIWLTGRTKSDIRESQTTQEATVAAQDVNLNWVVALILAYNYADAPGLELRAGYDGFMATSAQSLDEAIRLEEESGRSDDAAQLRTYRSQFDALRVRLEEAFDLADAGATDEAHGLVSLIGLESASVGEGVRQFVAQAEQENAAATDSAVATVNTAVIGLTVAAVTAVVLGLVSMGFTARSISRPLAQLERAARAASAGDLSARAAVAGPRETRQLAIAFNLMIDRIEERDIELRESEQRWRSLILNARDMVVVVDRDGTVMYLSPAVENILGYTAEELIGTNSLSLVHPEDTELAKQRLATTYRQDDEHLPTELRVRDRDGDWHWIEALASTVNWFGARRIVINGRDITERRAADERISYMAYHDALTGLPNRLLFNDRFEVALAQARRSGNTVCVLSIDLDRFKIINDTLGHSAGDLLLREAARRLSVLVREGDTLARVGGDEFEALLVGCESVDDAHEVALRIITAFRQPFNIHGRACHTTASIGISVYREDGDDAETLLRHADVAMYAAKDAGRDSLRRYAGDMSEGTREWLAIESELRLALERGEIEVFYQPQVSIHTGEIMGVEALARWRHPRRGIVSPLTFIPVAEETGLVAIIGEQVMRRACEDAVAWEADGLPPLRVAVNVSYRQIQDAGFTDAVRRACEDAGLDPRRLQLEITESTALKDLALTRTVAGELAAMGVRLSIDDFGAGSTSLRYLTGFPVSELKIDRGFIRDLEQNPDNGAIATSVIALGHQLNLNVIAEGVETAEQLQFLRSHGCDEFQGFLHSRPMPEADLRRVVSRRDSVEA